MMISAELLGILQHTIGVDQYGRGEPSISLVAYDSRDKARVFVKVPDERGRYMLTSRCVVVPCTTCGAVKGEPCKSFQGYMVETHYARRSDWKWKRADWRITGLPPDQVEKPHFKLMIPVVRIGI